VEEGPRGVGQVHECQNLFMWVYERVKIWPDRKTLWGNRDDPERGGEGGLTNVLRALWTDTWAMVRAARALAEHYNKVQYTRSQRK